MNTANAMIVSAQPEASEAGAKVLMRGGNAVDAAIAAALVQGVVDPQMCGIAGFGNCGRSIYFRDDGGLKRIGDRVHNPDLATTLERIAREGVGVFYRGEIAGQIDADMKANGGLLSMEDLGAYRTNRGDPLRNSYREQSIYTNAQPGGGIMLLEMLNILEQFDLRALGHNSTDYIRIVCAAMKAATSDKDEFVGDAAFVDVPVERLTSKDHALQVAERIKDGERMSVARLDGPPEPADTTHVAVVDGQGNCVTMTHSPGMPSGVITDGLGFMIQPDVTESLSWLPAAPHGRGIARPSFASARRQPPPMA